MTLGVTSPAARVKRHGQRGASLFVWPLIAIMALTTLLPVGYAIVLSFFDWNWGNRFNFIGFGNYATVMQDADFWWSVIRTLSFAVVAVSVEVAIGLGLAILVNRMNRGIGWIRTALMLPMMVSGIVVALVWKLMLDPTLGVIPRALSEIGLGTVDLLGNQSTALLTVAGLDAWWQTGFVFIVLSAALAALPTEPFEAAAVDGAGRWQTFRHVTMPMLLPAILMITAIRLVDCLKVFALVYGTTEGGPLNATEVTQILVYRTAFKEFAMSQSMTMMLVYSFVIAAILIAGYLVFRKVNSRDN